jgi:hypothetical protein
MRDWTWQPGVLLAARRELGQTVEALAKLVSPQEMPAARRARMLARLQRQRAMLKGRAEKARTATKRGKP